MLPSRASDLSEPYHQESNLPSSKLQAIDPYPPVITEVLSSPVECLAGRSSGIECFQRGYQDVTLPRDANYFG